MEGFRASAFQGKNEPNEYRTAPILGYTKTLVSESASGDPKLRQWTLFSLLLLILCTIHFLKEHEFKEH